MKRAARLLLAATFVVLIALALEAAMSAPAGGTGPTLSFFSGGLGARAGWVAGNKSIRLQTTKNAGSHVHGFAGILISDVSGPAVSFPDSSFSSKASTAPGATLSSPRLVVEFQTERGKYVGAADLRETTRGSDWERVDDRTNYPRAAWDVLGGPCGFLSNVRWTTVQKCFVGDKVVSVFIVADALGISQLIDEVTIGDKTFSSASDNGGGDNRSAGPRTTTDPALLPKILFPTSS